MVKNLKQKNGSRRNNGVIDLSNFGQTNRRTIVASFQRALTTDQVEPITIGRAGVTGSQTNPLAAAWLGNETGGWPLENIRVKAIRVVFDCRGVLPAAGSPQPGSSSSFNARPRVGAFMSGQGPSSIDQAKILANIEAFGGSCISPNQSRTITVRVGPEFALGRFGETGANQLVVYARGFVGFARVFVHYEVLGFPAASVIA